MLAPHRPFSLAQIRNDNLGDVQIIQADRRRNNVHNRVHRPHFMEMYLFNRNAMGLALCLGKYLEGSGRNPLCPGGYLCFFDNGKYFRKTSVPVMVMGMPLMCPMAVPLMPLMAVPMMPTGL